MSQPVPADATTSEPSGVPAPTRSAAPTSLDYARDLATVTNLTGRGAQTSNSTTAATTATGPESVAVPMFDGDPSPLRGTDILPEFPIGALPAWVGDYVEAVAVATQTPLDLGGCIALAALSTATGGRAIVQIRPGWTEPVHIFTVVALPPGARKSAVFAAMTAPLLTVEQELVDEIRPTIVDAETERKAALAAAERLAKKAGDADAFERDDALTEAKEAARRAEEIIVPALPQLIADDITPEAAASLLAEQGGRLAVLSDEGGIFGTLAGRYSASGGANLDVFLKGHAAGTLRVNRKGHEKEHIERTCLTLGLAVQPEILRAIAENPSFRGVGLLGRILYALPENLVGRRQPGAPAAAETLAAAYDAHLTSLVTALRTHDKPVTLTFTDEANQVMLDAESRLEPDLAPTAKLGHIADWAGKLNGAIARLAAIIHLAGHHSAGTTNSWDIPIDADTMHAAHALGQYYLDHARAVFDFMGTTPDLDAAQHILDWITRHNVAEFSQREVFNGIRSSRFQRVPDLTEPLTLLESHGHIAPIPPPERGGRGRPPSPRWHVHPAIQTGGRP